METTDLDVGYIELPLNGKDHTGRYITKTKGVNFIYDIKMKATTNLVGHEQYSIWVEWKDDQGHSGQWEEFRSQGDILHLSNGHAKVSNLPYREKSESV